MPTPFGRNEEADMNQRVDEPVDRRLRKRSSLTDLGEGQARGRLRHGIQHERISAQNCMTAMRIAEAGWLSIFL